MSLILDALRKSERTRQQSLTGQLGAGETPPAPARLALPWTTLLGLLLLVNAVALAILFWRGSDKPAASAPQTASLPAVATPYRPEVRPLANEAGAEAQAASRPAANPTVTQSPAPLPAAAPQAAVPAPAPTLSPAGATPPTLDALPTEVRQTLPVLHLDVLGYAPDPKQRFVVINLQRYAIGDSTPDGVRVADITSQGAVLEFHATRFLLTP
jgi:hypothetical protein